MSKKTIQLLGGGLSLVTFFLCSFSTLAAEDLSLSENSFLQISTNSNAPDRLITPAKTWFIDQKITLTDSLNIKTINKNLNIKKIANHLEINLSPDEQIYGISSNSIRLNDITTQQSIYTGLKNETTLIRDGTYYFQIGHGTLTAPLLISSQNYALYFDVLGKTAFTIDHQQGKIIIKSVKNSDLENCSIYLITGSDFNKIWQWYGQLVGQIPLPPKYIFGLLYSKWGILDSGENEKAAQEKLLNTLDQFSDNKIPLDALLLDYDWYKNDFYWRQNYFPNPDSFLQELNNRQLDFIPIRKPRLTNYWSQERVAKNNWELDSKLSDHLNLDFFQANLNQRWYQKNKTQLFNKGITALWLDEADDILDDFQFETGNSWQVGNAWYQKWNNELSKLFQKDFPNQRFLTLNRAGIPTMSQHGGTFWSGDIESNWYDLSRQVSYLLNASLLGFPYVSLDIGGFLGQPDDELYTRYLQLGTFFPITRLHGYRGTTREPFNFSAETLQIAQKFINLKYQLLPFWYSLAYQNHLYHQPLITFSDNQSLDQLLIGNSLLVQPIVEKGIQEKRILLPAGQWFDFWEKENIVPLTEKIITEKITIESLPFYVKAGSILPILPEQNFTNSKNLGDDLDIKIYLGEANNNYFELYNDDGKSKDYQSNQFSLTGIKYNKTDYGLSITVQKNNEQFKFNNWHWFVYDLGFEIDKVLQDGQEIPFVQTSDQLIFHNTNQNLFLTFDIIRKNNYQVISSSNSTTNYNLTRQQVLNEIYLTIKKDPKLNKEFITNSQCPSFEITDNENNFSIEFKQFLNCLKNKNIISGQAEIIEKITPGKKWTPLYFTNNLWKGIRNQDVANLQLALQQLGFYNDQIVGIYGPKTKTAVYEFQKHYGLDQIVGQYHHGIFSKTTRQKMNELQISLEEETEQVELIASGNYSLNLEQTINRAEASKIISLLWWLAGDGGALPYLDVNKSDWFYPYIQIANQHFPQLEYSSQLFKPAFPLSKIEWAIIKKELIKKEEKIAKK